MKHLPKSTPTEILNDPYGFTYKEMSEVIGEDKARALYAKLYKQPFHKKNLSISTKKVYKSSDTEKYVYELKDNRYIETVFIKRRDGGTVCVSTQVGCSVGCIFCESGRNGFVRNLTPSEIVQQVVLIRQKVNRIVFMGMGEPLFNYDNLIAAIHILRDRNGLNFPTDGITVYERLFNNYKSWNAGLSEKDCLMIGDASGLEGQFSDSDKKTAENFGIDYMDVSEFVNVYGEGV